MAPVLDLADHGFSMFSRAFLTTVFDYTGNEVYIIVYWVFSENSL